MREPITFQTVLAHKKKAEKPVKGNLILWDGAFYVVLNESDSSYTIGNLLKKPYQDQEAPKADVDSECQVFRDDRILFSWIKENYPDAPGNIYPGLKDGLEKFNYPAHQEEIREREDGGTLSDYQRLTQESYEEKKLKFNSVKDELSTSLEQNQSKIQEITQSVENFINVLEQAFKVQQDLSKKFKQDKALWMNLRKKLWHGHELCCALDLYQTHDPDHNLYEFFGAGWLINLFLANKRILLKTDTVKEALERFKHLNEFPDVQTN